MMVLLTSDSGSYAQFVTVLILFVVVLGLTALVTRWLAGYQKQQGGNNNIEILEAGRIGNNKYIQLVRVGEKIMAIAVCKDTVTMLGEIPKEQLREGTASRGIRFGELLERAAKRNSEAPKESQAHEEP